MIKENEFPESLDITLQSEKTTKKFNLLNVKVMQNFNDLIEYIWI